MPRFSWVAAAAALSPSDDDAMLEPGSWSSAAAGARLLAMNALAVPEGTTTEAADARPASGAAADEAAAGAAVWACAPCAAFISRAAAN